MLKESIQEARQYSRKEVTEQFEKAYDEMMEAIYQIGQHDKAAMKKIGGYLDDMEAEFKDSGI